MYVRGYLQGSENGRVVTIDLRLTSHLHFIAFASRHRVYAYLSELIYDDLTMICERNHIGVICQSVTCHVILISVLYFVDFVEFSQVVVSMSSSQ